MRFIVVIWSILWMPLGGAAAIDRGVFELLKERIDDKQHHTQTVKSGRERAVLCGYCHGKDGNSVKNYIPNLAAQNPEYLVNQFEQFAKKQRKNYVMERLAASLSDSEKVNLALYFASLKVSSRTTEHPELVAKGKSVFFCICYTCHGKDALGKENLPRLAGQPEDYIVKTLHYFKSGQKRNVDSPMPGIVTQLTDQEIKAVAAYITSM
ncbi:c-type cytochrome [Zooshikella harenae]|uniref:Cytochrome c4 n=1 Tax=Zooshikella harenae TaxID=2827238 RepID=A0ABS5ZEJ5_9GAMM|nr:c-type cytochrome [Zooshikella harenae]MBU2712158.1 cytochrome c4 [Zooshikella harenae]